MPTQSLNRPKVMEKKKKTKRAGVNAGERNRVTTKSSDSGILTCLYYTNTHIQRNFYPTLAVIIFSVSIRHQIFFFLFLFELVMINYFTCPIQHKIFHDWHHFMSNKLLHQEKVPQIMAPQHLKNKIEFQFSEHPLHYGECKYQS